MKEWKVRIINIVDKRSKSNRKAMNRNWSNQKAVCRLHYINTLKQELNGTKAYEETSIEEKSKQILGGRNICTRITWLVI